MEEQCSEGRFDRKETRLQYHGGTGKEKDLI